MERTIDGFASKEESCTVTVSFTDAEEWRMHLRMALPLNWSHPLSWSLSSLTVKKITAIAFAKEAQRKLSHNSSIFSQLPCEALFQSSK